MYVKIIKKSKRPLSLGWPITDSIEETNQLRLFKGFLLGSRFKESDGSNTAACKVKEKLLAVKYMGDDCNSS